MTGEHASGLGPGTPTRAEVPSELAPLIPRYLENRRADVIRLREALERGDLDTVGSVGHSMKGTGGGYGFQELTEIGGRIEACARAKDSSSLRELLEELEAYLEEVDVVYVE